MAIIVNGQRIEDAVIAEEIERMRGAHGGCGCGCGDGECDDTNDCECGDDCVCDDAPSADDGDLREMAENYVVMHTLLAQTARQLIPASTPAEIDSTIKKMVAEVGTKEEFLLATGMTDLEEPRLRHDVDMSLRVGKLLEGVAEKVPAPSLAEAKKFYEEFPDEMIDDEDRMLPFEEISDQLIEELHTEAKNAAVETFLGELIVAAKIEHV